MTERARDAVRRILHDDPTIDVCYTFAIRADSSHQGNGVLFVHPSHEFDVAAARAHARGQL